MAGNDRKSDELYRSMASHYADEYGKQLQQELAELEQQPDAADLSRMDWLVRKNLHEVKNQDSRRTRRLSVGALIAACLIIAIAVPAVLNRPDLASGSSSADAAEIAEATDEAVMDAAPAPEPEADMQTEADARPAEDYEVIPLSAELPVGFTLSSFEQDREKSIYYLEDLYRDDVVVTLEKSNTVADSDSLVEIDVDGTTAYGFSGGDYSLMTFLKDDVLYTLTCKHDINTLYRLSQNFI